MIGSLSQLVRGAAILAIEDGTEQITRDLLDTVPVDYAAERADRPRRRTTDPGRRDRLMLSAVPSDRRPAGPARNHRLLPGPAGEPARP